MYFKKVNTMISKRALIFLLLFVIGTLLIKPVHIFIHDHQTNTTAKIVSVYHENCEICSFQFSTFLSTPSTQLDPICFIYLGKIEAKSLLACNWALIDRPTLRAPPVA